MFQATLKLTVSCRTAAPRKWGPLRGSNPVWDRLQDTALFSVQALCNGSGAYRVQGAGLTKPLWILKCNWAATWGRVHTARITTQ